MKGNNGGERIWVTDVGDDVVVSFKDGPDEGEIYLTPKKVRKLIAKLEATLEHVQDGDDGFIDREGDAWRRLNNGKYCLAETYESGGPDLPGGRTIGQIAADYGPLSRP